MIIGNFKLVEENLAGTIRTLTFKVDAVFEAIERRNEKSPDYRITSEDAEIGAAWKETSEAGKPYLSVQLDAPGLAAPIKCALVKVRTEDDYSLVWDRPRRRD